MHTIIFALAEKKCEKDTKTRKMIFTFKII